MNQPEELTKELVGLGAEYAVASELCRRGLYAQLTLGNRKSVDILVEGDHLARIQVKSKQGKTWPSVKKLREGDFLVLVDVRGKKQDERPSFFVLNSDDYSSLVRSEIEGGHGKIGPSGEFEYKSGWKGLAINSLEDVEKYRDRWDKILLGCGPTTQK